MKDEMFFAEEIEFKVLGGKIGKKEIDEIDDFPGKEDFIEFYTIHNGIDFIEGAWFVPESCYNSSILGTSYITLALFLRIPMDEKRVLNIYTMRYLIEEKYESFEDFVLFHIPFAVDGKYDPFWIDIQTGEIKYIDFEENTDPDDVITVASSFKEFCKQIKGFPS